MPYAGAARLEEMSRLIREGVAALAQSRPGGIGYGEFDLCGTIERQLYIQASNDPSNLALLQRALQAARARFDYSRFQGWEALAAPAAGAKVGDFIRSQRALAGVLLGRGQRASPAAHGLKPQFVFCVIDPRFLPFFTPLIERLGTSRCAVLCLGSEEAEREAIRRDLPVLPVSAAAARASRLRRPPHALGPSFAVALRHLLGAQGSLKGQAPTSVVFAEGISPQEEALARVARADGIPTLRIQYGRGGVIHPGYFDMPFDKMLMWGEGFIDRIRPYSPHSRYVVTGSTLFDPGIGDDRAHPALAAFAAQGDVLTVITQPVSPNISQADYDALVKVASAVLDRPEARVLVRRHPGDRSGAFEALAAVRPDRVLVTRAADHRLRAVLDASTLVVGLFSTVLSEAAAFGVLPVVLRLGERHRIFPAPEDEGAAALAESPEAAVSSILKLLPAPAARAAYKPAMERFAERYFGPRDGGALARIVTHIEHPEL